MLLSFHVLPVNKEHVASWAKKNARPGNGEGCCEMGTGEMLGIPERRKREKLGLIP